VLSERKSTVTTRVPANRTRFGNCAGVHNKGTNAPVKRKEHGNDADQLANQNTPSPIYREQCSRYTTCRCHVDRLIYWSIISTHRISIRQEGDGYRHVRNFKQKKFKATSNANQIVLNDELNAIGIKLKIRRLTTCNQPQMHFPRITSARFQGAYCHQPSNINTIGNGFAYG